MVKQNIKKHYISNYNITKYNYSLVTWLALGGKIMNINTEIADNYFAEKNLENVKNHWIFNSIIEGKHTCVEPPKEHYEKLLEICRVLKEVLKNFKPINLDIWEAFFGKFDLNDEILKDLNIYIIVGSPSPYDAMVREDTKGNKSIIYDLERISSYSNDNEKIVEIIKGLITHEMAHIFISKDYKYPDNKDSVFESLSHIVFDEGIAHFLSYKDDILSVDFNSEDMKQKRKRANEELMAELRKDDPKDSSEYNEIIARSNSGDFWGKFGAISGLFAVADKLYWSNKDLNSLKKLYDKGPKSLVSSILRNNIVW